MNRDIFVISGCDPGHQCSSDWYKFCCIFGQILYSIIMKFNWDPDKNQTNQKKHGISFLEAGALWDDPDRIEIEAPFPLENRFILIGKIDNRYWTAIYTIRKGFIRIISVRRSRKKERDLYEKEKSGQDQ